MEMFTTDEVLASKECAAVCRIVSSCSRASGLLVLLWWAATAVPASLSLLVWGLGLVGGARLYEARQDKHLSRAGLPPGKEKGSSTPLLP